MESYVYGNRFYTLFRFIENWKVVIQAGFYLSVEVQLWLQPGTSQEIFADSLPDAIYPGKERWEWQDLYTVAAIYVDFNRVKNRLEYTADIDLNSHHSRLRCSNWYKN